MLSGSKVAWVRVVARGALAMAFASCSVDQRDVGVAMDLGAAGLGPDAMTGAGGLGDPGAGAEGALAAGGPGTSPTPPGESGPEPTGLNPPEGVDVSSGSEMDDGRCVEARTEPCGPEREEGICRFGTRRCVDGEWGACEGAVLPAARDCSSEEDNDCDGQPDSTVDDVCRCPVGGTQACEEHPGLDGRGPCVAGTQTCVAGSDNQTSDWGPCEGSVGPSASDSCDIPGDDADCDGSPNGGCRCVEGATVACGPNTDDGACQRGQSTCIDEEFDACQGAVFPSRRNCTSPVDNDCDGEPDDSLDATCTCEVGSTRTCGAHPGRDGNGPCRAGTQTCVAGNQNASSSFGACTGSVGPGQRDSCTVFGDDADCDGTPNGGCQCVAGRGNQPCAGDPNNSRCDGQGRCVPCQGNGDCSLVGGGRNLCIAGVCSAPRCGDGIIQAAIGETCDDGNTVSGDGCSKECLGGRAPVGGTSFASTHLCSVLISGGVVSCWGLNSSGQLGNGSVSNSMVAPVLAANISSAIGVALRGNDSCAVRADGTVACWGATYGARPVNIANVANATQIAGGMDGFCARQSNGGVTCWTTSANAAARSGLGNVVQVARGDRHGCFLRNDGVLFCEGGGSEGERGDNSFDFADAPEQATVFSDIVQVATGYRSTCVRTRNSGFVQCVGTGTTAGSPAALPNANLQPVTALGLDNAVKIVASEQHMCALTANDEVLCWGTGTAVGNGSTSGSARPVLVPLPRGAIDVGAGSFTSCALLDDGSTYCWGSYAPLAASTTPALINFP